MRIEEKMLILPALYIIKRRGTATTADLINELTLVFNPDGEDAEILSGRSDTKFSQKVRNLVSHRNANHMDEYTKFENGIYSLSMVGEKLLELSINEMDYFFSQKFTYNDMLKVSKEISEPQKKIMVYNEYTSVLEGKMECKTSNARIRSKMLRDVAIQYYSMGGRIQCEVCDFCFEDRYGKHGKGFVEIHHERPICQYDESGYEEFISDAVKYVKPLCSNCHSMIHRNSQHPITIDELKNLLKPSI